MRSMHSTIDRSAPAPMPIPPRQPAAHSGRTAVFPMPATQLAPAWVLAVFGVTYALFVVGAWAIFLAGWLDPLQRATGGLVTRTLVANLVLLALVLLIAVRLGRLRLVDVGLRWPQLGAGVVVTAAAWLLMQLAGLVAGLVATGGSGGGAVALDPDWAQRGVLAMLGVLVGQLCGNALVEEVAWRGFVLPQAYGRLLTGAWWRAHAGWTLVAALVVSQTAFALIHLPSRLASGLTGGDLLLDLLLPGLYGVVLALVYLRTGNLFVAIGLHALLNAPTLLFAGGETPAMVMLAVVALVLIVWPRRATFGRQNDQHGQNDQQQARVGPEAEARA